MRAERSGVGTAVVAALVVVIIVVGAVAAYYATTPKGVTTTTVVSSQTQTQTQTSTVTSTSLSTSVLTTGQIFYDPPNLPQLAQQEGGALTMYSIADPTSYAVHYAPVFQRDFPWAKVNFIPLDPGTLFTRPLAEFKAGHVTADLDQLDPATCILLNQQGAVQPENLTKVDIANGIPPELQSQIWTPFKIDPNVVFYNTNLVNDSNSKAMPLPKTYQDLTNSVYKGQLAIAEPSDNSVPGATFVGVYHDTFHGDNASWTTWMQGVKANAVFEPFGGAAYTDVSNGHYGLGIDTLNDIFNGVEAGLPVAVDWTIQPTYTIIDASCTMKGAPHPYMALLWDEWVLSAEGQLATIASASNPETPSMVALNTFIPSSAMMSTTGETDYENNFTHWSTVFHNIFGA